MTINCLDTVTFVFTIIFGNGAGSFSGFYGPFQVREAHNGPIDILAMGGLLGFIILFIYPIRLLYKSFLMNERLFFSISLVNYVL